jgi:sensor c-di-GMP phosphodiesterase-like protein
MGYRKIFFSILIFLTCLFISVSFVYLQAVVWFKNQQNEHMLLAVNQINSMLDNVHRATLRIKTLAGKECTPETIRQLRQFLAQTPNVGNIELTEEGVVYCSSLAGKIDSRDERREDNSLYLTSDIKSLRGHPFLISHISMAKFGLYTSTDAYYLRYILGSASTLSSVILSTQKGWMEPHGTIHYNSVPQKQNIQTASTQYPYLLSSEVDNKKIISFSLKNGKMIGLIITLLSAAIGVFYYYWAGRADTPDKLLRNALYKQEFRPYLQPIVKGKDTRLVGCEVLARWLHKNTVIPPDQFIPLAEQSGLIIPLTKQLIVEITDKFLSDFRPDTPFYISFNVSAPHLQSSSLFDDFQYLLERKDRNITLVIEITEREIVSQDEQVSSNIKKLRQHGVVFALDDFGTGYSSLELLHRIDISLIKIDKLFTSGIDSNSLYKDIIENIVDLARRIDAAVIVEGVETRQQTEYLTTLGEISFQGYLFSKPLPIDDFKAYMRSDARCNKKH